MYIETKGSIASSVCHIETTNSMASSICAYWNYGLQWPYAPVHIETTDSTASSVHWNYRFYGLICLCRTGRNPPIHKCMHIHYTFTYSMIQSSMGLLASSIVHTCVCTYWQSVKNNRDLCLPCVCKNILHGKYNSELEENVCSNEKPLWNVHDICLPAIKMFFGFKNNSPKLIFFFLDYFLI